MKFVIAALILHSANNIQSIRKTRKIIKRNITIKTHSMFYLLIELGKIVQWILLLNN